MVSNLIAYGQRTILFKVSGRFICFGFFCLLIEIGFMVQHMIGLGG